MFIRRMSVETTRSFGEFNPNYLVQIDCSLKIRYHLYGGLIQNYESCIELLPIGRIFCGSSYSIDFRNRTLP